VSNDGKTITAHWEKSSECSFERSSRMKPKIQAITSKNHPLGDVHSPALQVYCSSRQRSEKCLYGFVFFLCGRRDLAIDS